MTFKDLTFVYKIQFLKNYITSLRFIRIGRANSFNKVCIHKIVQYLPQRLESFIILNSFIC